MALTRRDLLLAGAVAFVAWGYLVHWLPILRYLGHALVLGAVLAILFLLTVTLTTSRGTRRANSRIALPTPSIQFLAPENWPSEISSFATARAYRSVPLYPRSPSISASLDALLRLLLRDFVSTWYGNITPDATFVNEIDRSIRLTLMEIRDRLLQKDVVEIVVSRIFPLVTAHLRDFDLAERAIRGKALNRNVTESEELNLALAAKYNNGRLHPAASLKSSDLKLVQQDHLRNLLARVLPQVLPEEVAKSRAVFVLVRELVSCAVLFPLTRMLADADTWNQLVEAYGRAALRDRKTVKRMRAALDEHASPRSKSRYGTTLPRLKPGDNERSFERFVRAIRVTTSLSDVRSFRSHITSQLKRESAVDGQDQTYLRRLEIGKRLLDQKVVKLATGGNAPSLLPKQANLRKKAALNPQTTTLVAVLKTAPGLSYFMEYMDRVDRMVLVQFWIVVDGFRNPLEDDLGDEPADAASVGWSHSDRMDAAQINEAYMTKEELRVPEERRLVIHDFLRAGRNATEVQYRRARTAILSTQTAVLEEMESQHFPEFKKTELFYKYLASDETSTVGPPQAESRESISSPLGNGNEQSLQVPLPMIRSTSQPPARRKDLIRTATSVSDLRKDSSSHDTTTDTRKSLDMDRKRAGPLFDDDLDAGPLANSTHSGIQEPSHADAPNQQQIIESMEAALNTIVAEAPKMDESQDGSANRLFGSPTSLEQSSIFDDPVSGPLNVSHNESVVGDRVKPSIASLGLVNTSSRIGVFSDDDLFPDEEKFIEDEYADSEDGGKEDEKDEEIHQAAPGDLGLAEAIAVLNHDIERLVGQESVVDTLTRKAELVNNTAELRILSKSKASLQREIRRKELQRQQYMVQETDNSLYGRSIVGIKSIMVGKEEDGYEFALYVIEVQRKGGEQMPATASWVVARRYSEFHDLHHSLRSLYRSVRDLDFPRRRMVMKLQREFLHKRRLALEAYLRQLLLLPEVCRSRELRSFLSQQSIAPHVGGPTMSASDPDAKDIVTRIYNSVTDGMDEFLGNTAVLDQLSVAGQNLMSAATTQMISSNAASTTTYQNGPSITSPANESAVTVAEAEAELKALDDSDRDRELEPFVKPICDLFLELFELNKGNNWLRGRAVVVVLHQLLGGTVERKVRDLARVFWQQESALLKHIDLIKTSLWTKVEGSGDNSNSNSDFQLRGPSTARTDLDRAKTRTAATVILSSLIPELAASVVGRANAQGAARRVSATMNNERLNVHLVFSILDELVDVLMEGDKEAG